MHATAPDQVAELRKRIIELEIKMIRLSGQEECHRISLSGLEERHEMWRKFFLKWQSTSLELSVIVMGVVTLVFVAVASRQ